MCAGVEAGEGAGQLLRRRTLSQPSANYSQKTLLRVCYGCIRELETCTFSFFLFPPCGWSRPQLLWQQDCVGGKEGKVFTADCVAQQRVPALLGHPATLKSNWIYCEAFVEQLRLGTSPSSVKGVLCRCQSLESISVSTVRASAASQGRRVGREFDL